MATPVELPFHTDVTRHLSSEQVHIIQNNILCVPNDDSELIGGGVLERFQPLAKGPDGASGSTQDLG